MDEKELRFIWRYAWGGIGFCIGCFSIIGYWMTTGEPPSESGALIVLIGSAIGGAAFPLASIDG